MIRGADHVSFSVADLDASIEFYTDVLGFEELWRLERDRSPELRAQVGYADAEVSIAQLAIPGGALKLELIAYTGSAGPAVERRAVGSAHLCLLVDDMEPVREALESRGAGFVSEPQYFDDGGGIRAVYLEDPDGITVELTQHLSRSEDAR